MADASAWLAGSAAIAQPVMLSVTSGGWHGDGSASRCGLWNQRASPPRAVAMPPADDLDRLIIPSGLEYRVRPVRTGPNPLRCDTPLTTSVVPVADFESFFITA